MSEDIRTHDALLTPEEYSALPKNDIYLVLDNLRSAFNVGAIFRTADASRIQKLLLCGYTAYPPHDKLEKTSMGTLPYVLWQQYVRTEDALGELKEKGIPVFALETAKTSVSIYNFSFPAPVALVLGNEALGVSPNVLRMVDGILEIPLFGFKNSINVATAAGIVLFEALRQHTRDIRPVPVYRK